MKRFLKNITKIGLLLLPAFLFSQAVIPGRIMDIPVAGGLPPDKPVFNVGLMFANRLKKDGISSKYKGIYPGSFGFYLGGGYRFFQAGIGFTQENKAILDLSVNILNEKDGMPAVAAGIDQLFIGSMESEATENVPKDSGGLRIPLYLALSKHIGDFFLISGGIGTGKFAFHFPSGTDSIGKINPVGAFWGIELRPISHLGIIWEGYMPSYKRNIGITVQMMPGLEALLGARYADYTFSKIILDHLVAGVRYQRQFKPAGKKHRKKAKILVFGKLYDEDGFIVPQGKVTTANGTITLKVRRDGSFSTYLAPGTYKIVVDARPKYDILQRTLEVTPDMSRLNFTIKLKRSKTYKELVLHLENARNKLRNNLIKDAYDEIQLARNIDSTDKRVNVVWTQIKVRIESLERVYRERAKREEVSGRLSAALSYWKKITELDPKNTEANLSIKRIENRLAQIKKIQQQRRVARQTTTHTGQVRKANLKKQIPQLMTRGKSLFYAGNYKEAKSIFVRVLSIDPNNSEAKYYLNKTNYYLKALGGGR